MSAMRRPARPAWRPVNTDVAAPTANSAPTESTADATMADVPLPMKKGMSGSSAPRPNATKDDERGNPRRPELARVEAELLAGERVERDVALLHDRVDQRLGGFRRHTLGAVDELELLALLLGERGELLRLDAQLVLVELAL